MHLNHDEGDEPAVDDHDERIGAVDDHVGSVHEHEQFTTVSDADDGHDERDADGDDDAGDDALTNADEIFCAEPLTGADR